MRLMSGQIQHDREVRIGGKLPPYVILIYTFYNIITDTFRRFLTLSYYQKNFQRTLQRHWEQAKTQIRDPKGVEQGDEIAKTKRPTWNQLGTLATIAPDMMKGLADELSIKN